jgi:hypothetical protein
MRLLIHNFFEAKERIPMRLLTRELLCKLPRPYTTEDTNNPLLLCRFYLSMTPWVWYPTEFDGKDTFYGYVEGSYKKDFEYFSLRRLENLQGPFRIRVQRDYTYKPQRLSEVLKMKGSACQQQTMFISWEVGQQAFPKQQLPKVLS